MKQLSNTQVPLPLAVVSGLLVGALVWLAKRRGAGDGGSAIDPLCAVGVCFNKERWNKYKRGGAL